MSYKSNVSSLISTYSQPLIFLGKFHRLFSAELTYFLEIFNYAG